jgi:hypothetical protein
VSLRPACGLLFYVISGGLKILEAFGCRHHLRRAPSRTVPPIVRCLRRVGRAVTREAMAGRALLCELSCSARHRDAIDARRQSTLRRQTSYALWARIETADGSGNLLQNARFTCISERSFGLT